MTAIVVAIARVVIVVVAIASLVAMVVAVAMAMLVVAIVVRNTLTITYNKAPSLCLRPPGQTCGSWCPPCRRGP